MTLNRCTCCGMDCEPREYHPYAACLLFIASQSSKVTRENLAAVVEHGRSIERDEAVKRGAYKR